MLQEERFIRIQSLLESFDRVTTEHLIQDMQVSRETVRQDLLALESLGLVRRVHGGVARVAAEEPPFVFRQATRVREKRAIAKAAVKLLSPGQMLFVDAGTTTSILAEELSLLSGLTVVTNSIPIAIKLSAAADSRTRDACQVVLLGGEVNPEVQCTHGPTTLGELSRYRADMALISPVGITAESGTTSFDERECHVARAMAEYAGKLVVLADHSKLGVESRYVTAPPDRIACLVTNDHAENQEKFKALEKAGIEVLLG